MYEKSCMCACTCKPAKELISNIQNIKDRAHAQETASYSFIQFNLIQTNSIQFNPIQYYISCTYLTES